MEMKYLKKIKKNILFILSDLSITLKKSFIRNNI